MFTLPRPLTLCALPSFRQVVVTRARVMSRLCTLPSAVRHCGVPARLSRAVRGHRG